MLCVAAATDLLRTVATPMTMRVLILEPYANGHHGPYLEWMTRGLLDRGFETIVITLPESMEHPSMRAVGRLVCVRGLTAGRNVSAPKDTLQLTKREFAYWRLFREWYRAVVGEQRPDVVFLPYLDYCLYAIGLLGSPFDDCPWVGLAMRPSFHYQEMGVIAPRPTLATLKKALFFRLARNKHLRCLLTIDESLAEYISKRTTFASKTAFLAEPAEMTDLLDPVTGKQRLGIPSTRKLILVYGHITPRKGVLELLRAITCPLFPPSVDVLLAGEVSPEVRNALMNSPAAELLSQGRIRLLDRFIEVDEERVVFAAADIVWLGYCGHYTASGVLMQAASAGRPVLACHEGIIGWQTRRHALGQTVDPKDPVAVCRAIQAALQSGSSWSTNRYARTGMPSTTFADACNLLAAALSGSSASSLERGFD